MSHWVNEEMLEKFFEEFLEEGFSDWEADKLAHEKLETIPTLWGQECIMQRLFIKRKKLKDELKGILAGMSDADEHEVAEKIKHLTFVINKIKRQRRKKRI